MDALRDGVWLRLSRGYVAQLSRRRRRHGMAQPPTFLVLAPKPAGEQMRPTLCNGEYVGGRCIIDRGVITLDMLAELEQACADALHQDEAELWHDPTRWP